MRGPVLALGLGLLAGTAACGRGKEAASPGPPTRAPVARPGALFVEKGCTGCHAVAAFGLIARQPAGPDLSLALEDTPRKFGVGLREFLESPKGTMQKVLGEQIRLTPAERDAAYEELVKAWLAHRTRQLPVTPGPAPEAPRRRGS